MCNRSTTELSLPKFTHTNYPFLSSPSALELCPNLRAGGGGCPQGAGTLGPWDFYVVLCVVTLPSLTGCNRVGRCYSDKCAGQWVRSTAP